MIKNFKHKQAFRLSIVDKFFVSRDAYIIYNNNSYIYILLVIEIKHVERTEHMLIVWYMFPFGKGEYFQIN